MLSPAALVLSWVSDEDACELADMPGVRPPYRHAEPDELPCVVMWRSKEGGVVRVRVVWAVLVFAAVVSMHGTPAVAADASAKQSTLGDVVMAASSVHGSGQLDGPDEAGPQPVESHQPGHGVDAHLWAACLAILLAGVTLVAAALRLRKGVAPLVRGPTSWGAWSSPWRFVARPPDLFVLCLLRV